MKLERHKEVRLFQRGQLSAQFKPRVNRVSNWTKLIDKLLPQSETRSASTRNSLQYHVLNHIIQNIAKVIC